MGSWVVMSFLTSVVPLGQQSKFICIYRLLQGACYEEGRKDKEKNVPFFGNM